MFHARAGKKSENGLSQTKEHSRLSAADQPPHNIQCSNGTADSEETYCESLAD